MLTNPSNPTTAERPFSVIIVGSPRSGTSMLHWALCEHEALWGSEESELLAPFADQIEPLFDNARQFRDHNWLDAQGVDFDEFSAALGAGIDALYASRSGGRHWVEQTPSNTWALPMIGRMLPTARFIHVHRDGRQVVESMRSMWGWGLKRAAGTWRDANELALEFGRSNPGRILRVAYESLISATGPTLQEVWRFLGLDNCPASIHFISRNNPINESPAFSGERSRDKLTPRFRDWSPRRRRRFDRIAGRVMAELGYNGQTSTE